MHNYAIVIGVELRYSLLKLNPSKQNTIILCWLNVGPLCTTLSRHWPSIESMHCVDYVIYEIFRRAPVLLDVNSKHDYLPGAVSMLAHRP